MWDPKSHTVGPKVSKLIRFLKNAKRKNKVLVGEYKTIDKKIDGALVAQKRNGDDFYISYNAKGNIFNIHLTL